METSGWLTFLRTEQLMLQGDPPAASPAEHKSVLLNGTDTGELSSAQHRFEQAIEIGSSSGGESRTVDVLQFAMLLLDPENDAVTLARGPSHTADFKAPLASFWGACSHNSCESTTVQTKSVTHDDTLALG
eukprot:5943675-Prymnesium_polylepis.2